MILSISKIPITGLIVKSDLATLEKKYPDIKFDTTGTVIPQNNLNFNSVEELDKFLKTLENDSNKNLKVTVPVKKTSPSNPNLLSALATYEDTYTIEWYAPFSGWGINGIATWKCVNIDYNYSFSNGYAYFTSYSSITSWVEGLIEAGWHQTGKAVNFTTTAHYHDTASIRVTGYYLLGISINGFPVGITKSDTWNCSLQLV